MFICTIVGCRNRSRKIKGRFLPTTQHPYQWKEDKEDPWQGSTPERSSVELSSRGAYPKVSTSSIQSETHSNAHICLCDESPCPMLQWYVDKFVHSKVLSKILSSSWSSSMIDTLRSIVEVYIKRWRRILWQNVSLETRALSRFFSQSLQSIAR